MKNSVFSTNISLYFGNDARQSHSYYWKRYVDDVLELIKKGQVRNLTDHINTVDPTGNIKFTCEEEEDKQNSWTLF